MRLLKVFMIMVLEICICMRALSVTLIAEIASRSMCICRSLERLTFLLPLLGWISMQLEIMFGYVPHDGK